MSHTNRMAMVVAGICNLQDRQGSLDVSQMAPYVRLGTVE